ncbi:MAG: YbaB/EbfC family nucleoid-associated protein [Coriobacteriales bacterium]|jgi:DNA-binding YbaB/EbfC family protein|nr:YbaB/EbfC family nucleoid-associated protein [Coriobacteriales bacterium]
MDMNKMMKQARKMQAELARVQEEVAQTVTTITAGGGMVTVTVLGDSTVQSIKIDPSVVDPDDVEMLEDLVTAAVNEALRSSQEAAAERMSAVTGGLNLPGL